MDLSRLIDVQTIEASNNIARKDLLTMVARVFVSGYYRVETIHLSKLLQKPYIILKKMPDVVDGIHKRGHTFESEAECES